MKGELVHWLAPAVRQLLGQDRPTRQQEEQLHPVELPRKQRHHPEQHMKKAPFVQHFAQIGASDTCRQQWTFVSELLRDVPCGGASLVSA